MHKIWKLVRCIILTGIGIIVIIGIYLVITYEDNNAPNQLDFFLDDKAPITFNGNITALENEVYNYAKKYQDQYYSTLYFDHVSLIFQITKKSEKISVIEFCYKTEHKKQYGTIGFFYNIHDKVVSGFYGEYDSYQDEAFLLDSSNLRNSMSNYIYYKDMALKKLKDFEYEEDSISLELIFLDDKIMAYTQDIGMEYNKEKDEFFLIK